MLNTDWKDLALDAQAIYNTSLQKTLELFPFDEETLKKYEALPSARGDSVTDFGSPAKVPIHEYKKVLPLEDKEITEMEPTELVKKLKNGDLTCEQVLKSYFHAAILASKLVNCVYEFLPEESLARAKELDSCREKLSNKLPLFGLPVSIKEMIPFKNRSVTHGSLCYLDRVVDYNADIVNILLKNGAFPFVRSTNPQSLMMLECESFTHGRTVNPFNSDLTCGGSSGGEGAINGIHASPIGLGSDIGGSIRCPAAFNGIYGMRTTLGRLPTADYFSCQMGSESILSVTGPLTRSLDLLKVFMKTIIDSKPWLVDPTLAAIEWKPITQKKFRIGILMTDEVVTPHPAITRGLKEVKEKLSKLDNVELVEFKPYDHAKAWEIISTLYFEDGGKDTKATLEATGEPMCPQTEWVLGLDNVKELDMHGQWHWNLEKQKYRKEYLKHWNLYTSDEGGILDAVIAPVFPSPAAKHRTTRYWGYTAQWNLLDYPVLVAPVSTFDVTIDIPLKNYKPLNEMDEYVYKQSLDPEAFKLAPINVGIVGLRNTDEKLIEIGQILKDTL